MKKKKRWFLIFYSSASNSTTVRSQLYCVMLQTVSPHRAPYDGNVNQLIKIRKNNGRINGEKNKK